jgi:hypothetical protein
MTIAYQDRTKIVTTNFFQILSRWHIFELRVRILPGTELYDMKIAS